MSRDSPTGDATRSSGSPEAECTPVTKDVFVSYASQDAAVANSVVEVLERQGIRCWIAPRDVTPGAFYADAIVHAIDAARAMVLVLSEHAAVSHHILREVERASSKRHPVISLRIDHAALPAGLEYFLNTSQWLEASEGDASRVFPRLVEAVRKVLAGGPSVEAFPAPSLPSHGSVPSPSRRPLSRPVAIISVLIIVAILGIAVKGWLSRSAVPVASAVAPAVPVGIPAIPEKSVAVLPFVDMSEKKDQEYFSDGLSEELIDMLTKVSDLRVPARTSSFYFKGKQATIADIAKVLSVSHVLEGSVRKSGNNLRITAQLIRVDSGYHVWSETYDRKLDDIFKVQDEIAGAVVKALKASLLAADSVRPAPTKSTEAYSLYLQGRFAAERAVWRDDLSKAIQYTERALEADPTFALAWAQLSRLYSSNWDFGDQAGIRKWREAALGAAKKSLELDQNLPEGRIALARISFYIDWDWTNAESEVSAARLLAPLNADVLAWMQTIAEFHGRWAESVSLNQQAIGLDPLNPANYGSLGNVYLRSGHPAEAEAAFRKSLELNPHNLVLHWSIAESMFLRGEFTGALTELQQEQEEGRDLGYVFLYHAMGRKAESDAGMLATEKKYARTAQWTAVYYLACARAYRGERDQAFEWLDRAFERHEYMLVMMKGDPLLRNLEGDPRYEAFLRKMKLP